MFIYHNVFLHFLSVRDTSSNQVENAHLLECGENLPAENTTSNVSFEII